MKKDNINLWIQGKYENLKYHGRKHAEEYAGSDQLLFFSPDHITLRNWLLGHLKVEKKKIDKLLDLGCGTGRWFHITENVDFVLGADFSSEMLNEAKKKIYGGGEHTNNINLVRCDIFNLPLKYGLFDCVVSVGVLAEHAPLNDGVSKEVGRIMKSGGLFLFTAQKIGIILKLKVKTANLLFPILPHSFKERIELYIKSFHTGLDHNNRMIKELAKRHDFDVQEIEVKALTKSDFYFVYAQRGV